MLADLPSKFGAPLRWGDEGYVAELFGERIESLEMGRLRTELGFANEAELRDFLKAYHPVGVALYSELGDDPEPVDDPELAAALDDALLGAVINLWYARGEGGSGTFAQETVFIVARKRAVAPARA
jgi:hypothetical protein